MENKALFLDFDGVIGNFDKYLYQQSRPTTPALADVPDDYMPQKMDFRCIPGFDFYKAFAALPATWPGELPIIPGSQEFLHEVSDMGVRIVLLTSVPEKSGIYRLQQMVAKDLPFDEAYFTMGQKKSDFIKMFESRECAHFFGDQMVFVDDMMKNAADVAENCPGVQVVTCDIPYNDEHLAKLSPEVRGSLNLVRHTPGDMEATARAMHSKVIDILRR